MSRKTDVLKREILEYIQNENLALGDRLPPEATLCSVFGVSRTTIRGAFATLEREGVIERRQGSGTFLACPSTTRNNIIAAIIPSFSPNPEEQGSYDKIMESIEDCAFDHSYSVTLCLSANQVERAEKQVKRAAANNVAGIIYTPICSENMFEDNMRIITQIEDLNIPFVLIGNHISNECLGKYSFVGGDDYRIMHQVTRYALEKGFSKIAFIRGFSRLPSSNKRFEGFCNEMSKHGLSPREGYVRILEETPLNVQGQKEIKELLALGDTPDLVICDHDIIAANVIEYLHSQGVKVPDDIAVIGFGDIPRARTISPSLTTVHQPFDAIGKKATEILLEKIEGKLNGERQEFIGCELIPRESC